MSRLARASSFVALGLASLLLFTAGCHDHRTLLFLQLQANGGLSGVQTIDVQLALAGKSASVKLREKSGAAIAFPTGDIIDIGSGAGTITVSAIARDGSGNQLAMAAGTTTIAAGESSALTLVFGGGDGDGGMPTDDGDLSGSSSDLAGADLAVVGPDLNVTPASPDLAPASPDLAPALPDLTPPPVDMAKPIDFGGSMPPGPPTDVTATAQVLSATVSWKPPASDGGQPIILYTVTSNPDHVQATTSGATTVVINGLRQGGSYTFTVTATNGVGTGAMSLPSSPAVMPSNLALTATLSASSTYNNPGVGVYNVVHINDGDIDTATDGSVSWSNGEGTSLPQSVTLDFGATRTPTVVHLYTSFGYPTQAFNVQMGSGSGAATVWTTVASVSGNQATYVNVPLTPTPGNQLRVSCTLGSTTQPSYVRINELEVY